MNVTIIRTLFIAILSCHLICSGISGVSAAIPGDLNKDHEISRTELSDAIISYMGNNYAGDDVKSLEKEALRETARKHFTMTVTDLAGREVTVPTRVERVVLGHSLYIQEFAAVEGEDFTEKIVGWGSELETKDFDTYSQYLEVYPEIADIPIIGSMSRNTFDTESVVSLNPDVVIMPLMRYEAAKENIQTLESVGIPVLIVDFWKSPLENTQESTLLLGKVMGKEERAENISEFYGEQMDLVYSTLESIDPESSEFQKVYVEYGSRGPTQYGITFSDSNWGPMITKLGAVNVAEGVASMSAIDPEYLLSQNPDIIIIAGQYWPENPDSMGLGYSTSTEDSIEDLQGFCTRSGWDTLVAVEDNNVHGIHHGISYHIYNFVGMQALAKWIYPQEFADMDPDANLQEFHERYLPVNYTGTWIVDIDEV
ncbi:MAG: iron complex transport system substrate-binding protein [Methanolobus sp.]|jgi:iron complex transport system substrate-binding protein|uniref:ABC transporter substrate-binding protein n=1 Tax=Methanolobus sp. TaxID=1874737 RepID=UPI0024ABF225|nr:ABC transporter substrate-binding protein [Methanolobus sp.]MDI3484992.1 iron complex transport system substrate-binding protein [Methanolobus sp.]MDK2830637.1 iron complex transport system substrate-binding protein [Methanolobus sp.]